MSNQRMQNILSFIVILVFGYQIKHNLYHNSLRINFLLLQFVIDLRNLLFAEHKQIE
jgi:hypothetical protein